MKKLIISFVVLLSVSTAAKAQFAVVDPTHIATSITNMAKNIAQTSTTASNMINNYKETVKIFEQGKKYYDALKSVHDLVKDARKVKETLLLVNEISGIYIDNFQKMMSDPNYTLDELNSISAGYAKLMKEAGNMLLDLKDVTSVTGLSMTDKERMEIIDAVHNEVVRFRNLTVYYTNKNISVSFIRAQKANDLKRVKELYGGSERYW